MKRFILIVTLFLVCINLFSCSAFNDLSYSISGDIIDPVEDFSRGKDKGVFVYDGNNYILIDEVSGNFDFDIVEEDIDARVAEMAEMQGVKVEEFKKNLDNNAINQIANELLMKKLLDFLRQNNTIK